MKIVVFDCTDHPETRYRGVTLRMFEGSDMLLQGALLAADPRAFGESLARQLGAEYVFVGPSTVLRPPAAAAAVSPPRAEPKPTATLDPPAEYKKRFPFAA